VVRLHETATVWSANGNENYDKKTGLRIGAPGRCRLLLETIKPIEKNPDKTTDEGFGGELSAQALVAIMKEKPSRTRPFSAASKNITQATP
jgi:hypothetical protein